MVARNERVGKLKKVTTHSLLCVIPVEGGFPHTGDPSYGERPGLNLDPVVQRDDTRERREAWAITKAG